MICTRSVNYFRIKKTIQKEIKEIKKAIEIKKSIRSEKSKESIKPNSKELENRKD